MGKLVDSSKSNKQMTGLDQANAKDIFKELKKVTWPKVGFVIQQTSIVLAVVLFFTIVIFGIDFGLSKLFDLIIK